MPFYATLGVSAANVIQTAISGKLVDHPKLGRRILELTGLGLMFFSTVAMVGAMSLSVSRVERDGNSSTIFSYILGILFCRVIQEDRLLWKHGGYFYIRDRFCHRAWPNPMVLCVGNLSIACSRLGIGSRFIVRMGYWVFRWTSLFACQCK